MELETPNIHVKWSHVLQISQASGKQELFLFGPRGLLAFEIKRTARITSAMLGGLKSFVGDYPMAKAYFVYAGSWHLYDGNIEIVPVSEILKNLKKFLSKGK